MPSSRPRNLTAVLLLASIIFGLNSVFGQAYLNGWMGCRTYQRFDNLHMLGSIIFATVVDGTAPQLSLYAFRFAGQLVLVFAVMMIERLRVRECEEHFVLISVLWGMCMQMFSYAVTIPICALTHIFTSSAATTNGEAIRPHYLAPLDLKVIIPAFEIGYFLPPSLFAYSFCSGVVLHWCGAMWQLFPQSVVLLQVLLVKLFSFSSPLSWSEGTKSQRDNYQALSKVCNFAFNVAAAIQLFTSWVE